MNLEKVLKGEDQNNILLQSLDQVKVYSMTEMIPKNYVFIDGHVKRPGNYLLQKNMKITWESYIGEVVGNEGVKLEQQYLVGENGLELMSHHPLEKI